MSFSAIAQDCDCLISEVENNTVKSCNYSIGTEVIVGSVAEFKNAVRQANQTGGNMTILIEDGTYQVATPVSYPYVTASNVVFRSLSGNRDAVILTGTGMADVAPNTENGIFAVGDNITIADLTIKEVGNHAISLTGNNIFVYNVRIQNTFEQMIKGNGKGAGNVINNGKVKCSLLEYTNRIGPQWYIGGLDIHAGTNWVVSDNVFKNISSPSLAVAEHAIHFWRSSADNLIERNKIVNCDRGIGFGLGDSQNSGGIIKNNMITNDGQSIYSNVGIGVESSPNTQIYNNTIFVAHQNAIEYRFDITTGVKIYNNLTNKPISSRNNGSATINTNKTDAVASWFVNLGTGDLRLADNIPGVVDAGTTLPNVTLDIDKTVRTQSNDIGACQYNGVLSVDTHGKANNEIIAYTLPASNQVTVKSTLPTSSTITVYNVNGQKTAFFKDKHLNNGFQIDVKNWSNGVYFFNVSTNTLTKTLKLVVSK